MKTLLLRSKWAMCAAVLVLAACGDPADDDKPDAKCPVVEGDRHLAGGDALPDGMSVMVHVVGRECLVTGENKFHMYEVGAGEMGGMHHSAYRAASMNKVDSLTVTAVEATMPSMGHGTAQDPVLHGGGAFDIAFQMPGEWELNVKFSSDATTTVQMATFTVTVQ